MTPQSSNIKVSVILALHNSEKTLEKCLDSVLAQTYSHFEIVMIDDASTDGTLALLKRYQKQVACEKIRIFRNAKNLGLTGSLNKGIQAAKGEYIARIDDDDWWDSTKLEKQVHFLEKHLNHGIVGTFYINVNQRNQKIKKLVKSVTDSDLKRTCMRYNPFGHSTVLARKSLLEQVRGYDETIRYAQDYDLWLRCLPHTKFHNLPEFLCFRSAHAADAISSKKQRKQALQGFRTRLKYLRLYHYPFYDYFFLARPLILLVIPNFVKKIKRHLLP